MKKEKKGVQSERIWDKFGENWRELPKYSEKNSESVVKNTWKKNDMKYNWRTWESVRVTQPAKFTQPQDFI